MTCHRPGPILHGMRRLQRWLLLVSVWFAAACSTLPPEGVVPVEPFDAARYEGRWYEIARLDHGFERGLTDVSAHYRLQSDGSVAVINRGFDVARGQWRQATGRALFIGSPRVGSLKVSFFGPFYGGYHVLALDPDYRWSLVSGPSRSYLWILARERTLPAEVRERLVARASDLGFDAGALIWVTQNRPESD